MTPNPRPPTRSRVVAASKALLTVLFLGTLIAFAVWTLGGPGAGDTVSVVEKRTLAPFPAVPRTFPALTAFPSQFEAWFNDHLAGRAWLFQHHSLLQLRLWHQSSSPDVVIGKQGWLFYNARPFPEKPLGTILDDYRGLVRLSPMRMAFMELVLEARRAWLARQGIQYLFVVAPDKQSVYPEDLPDELARKVHPDTALDQFEDFLQSHSRFPLLDLRPALSVAKRPGRPLYLRTDTHWNCLGAQIGEETIVARLRTLLPIRTFPPEPALTRKDIKEPGGDLARLLNLADDLPETSPFLKVAHPSIQAVDWPFEGVDQWKEQASAWRSHAAGAQTRVLLFRDSFFIKMLPTFLEQCAEVVDIHWKNAGQPSDFAAKRRLLEQYHPDVVVEEVVERDLLYVLTNEGDPDLSEEVRQCLTQ